MLIHPIIYSQTQKEEIFYSVLLFRSNTFSIEIKASILSEQTEKKEAEREKIEFPIRPHYKLAAERERRHIF